MHKVTFNAGSNTIAATQLEFNPFDDDPAQDGFIGVGTDFDLDCANAILSDDECVLVATLLDGRDGATSEPPGSLFSLHFHVDPIATVVDVVEADWVEGGQYNAQAVLGVAVTSRLIVSAGRRSDTSSVQNSRIAEFDNYDVTVGDRLLNYIHKSDAETCSTTTVWGITMGGATPHGGESLAWCPSCSGGRSISLHLGKREDGDAFCF